MSRRGLAVVVASLCLAAAWLSRERAAAAPSRRPSFEGVWTNGTLTAFERPSGMANEPFFSVAEAAAFEQQATERRESALRSRRPGDIGGDNEAFVDAGYKVASTRQTALVVDPPDGRVPLLPSVEARRR
jgi:hypothetical protein